MNYYVDVRPSDEGGGFTCEVRELVNGVPAGPLHAFGKGPTKDQAREAAIGSTDDPAIRQAIGEGTEDLE